MPLAHPLDLALADLDDVDDAAFAAPVVATGHLARTLLVSVFLLGILGLSVGQAPTAPAPAAPVASLALASASVDDIAPRATRAASRSRTVPGRAASALKPKLAVRPSAQRTVKRHAAGPSWVRPSGAGVVSSYGIRWGRMHKGVDFGAHSGDAIRAIGDGVVLGAGYLGSESGYGQITLIRHKGGIISAYAHQSKVLVHVGERVHAGEVIGRVGSTGHSTGPHLHFEIRTSLHGGQVNPLRWLRAHKVRV